MYNSVNDNRKVKSEEAVVFGDLPNGDVFYAVPEGFDNPQLLVKVGKGALSLSDTTDFFAYNNKDEVVDYEDVNEIEVNVLD